MLPLADLRCRHIWPFQHCWTELDERRSLIADAWGTFAAQLSARSFARCVVLHDYTILMITLSLLV